MLLEGRGSAACLVSSIKPEENGKKNTVLSWKSGRSSNGTSYFQTNKQTNKQEPKKAKVYFLQYQGSKTAFYK